MSHGKFLSNEEKTKIDAFRKRGIGLSDIGRRIKRSVKVIKNYIKLG